VVLSVTAVAIEGFLGGVLRDLLDAWVGHRDKKPYGL
jgi:fluoride ion exporter CrcB/FEX